MDPITPPRYIRAVMETMEAAGFHPYLVGGCVRDALMGRRPHDWDLCSDALPEQVTDLFPRTVPTGIRHGTVTILHGGGQVEITTFRRDGDYADHRRPESVRFVSDLQGDLERRDFTMNAIALSSAGELTDPFGGRADIAQGLIRCVGKAEDRFEEDALRMLRALRFRAQLGFRLEENTWQAILKKAPLAEALSAERVRDEVEKLLLSPAPEDIAAVIDAGLLRRYVGETPAPDTLRRLRRLPKVAALRWTGLAALLREAELLRDCEAFLRALRLDGETVRRGAAGAELALAGLARDRLTLKRLLARCGPETARCACAAGDVLSSPGRLQALSKVLQSGECVSLRQLALSGDDLTELGLRGAAVGRALSSLLEHVLLHPEDNQKELLLDLAKENAGL